MQTETPPAPPETTGDPAVEARRRRRPWRWIAVAAGIAVVATAFGLWMYALHYVPLRNNIGTVPRFGHRIGSNDPTSKSDVWAIDYHDGATTAFALDLVNYGSKGITLTGVELPPITLLRQTGTHAGGESTCCGARYAELPPLTARSMPSETASYVVIAARFVGCERLAAGALDVVDHVLLHFRIFGVPRTEVLALDRPYVVVSPPDAGCLARTGGA